MHLYLVQHGAAKSEEEDPQRSLSAQGARTVETVVRFLAGMRLPVSRIEHSDKLRARQTAAILAARLMPLHGVREAPGLAPKDDPEPLRRRLQTEEQDLMLVGHLPHLSRLASRLLGLEADHAVVQFQMGGVVRLDRGPSGQWSLGWALMPEMLRPGRRLFGLHEYELKPGADEAGFERAIHAADARGLLHLPGLTEHYFLKGVKGARTGKYAALWVFESRAAWEALWGAPERPVAKPDYPANWNVWEDEVLAPFLDRAPDTIAYTDYEEL